MFIVGQTSSQFISDMTWVAKIPSIIAVSWQNVRWLQQSWTEIIFSRHSFSHWSQRFTINSWVFYSNCPSWFLNQHAHTSAACRAVVAQGWFQSGRQLTSCSHHCATVSLNAIRCHYRPQENPATGKRGSCLLESVSQSRITESGHWVKPETAKCSKCGYFFHSAHHPTNLIPICERESRCCDQQHYMIQSLLTQRLILDVF